MSYLSEEDVKTRLILLALQRAGWPTTKLMAEYSIRKDRFRIVPDRYVAVPVPAKDNRPDYLLCRRANCPIAVLEAKGGGARLRTASIRPFAMRRFSDCRLPTRLPARNSSSAIS